MLAKAKASTLRIVEYPWASWSVVLLIFGLNIFPESEWAVCKRGSGAGYEAPCSTAGRRFLPLIAHSLLTAKSCKYLNGIWRNRRIFLAEWLFQMRDLGAKGLKVLKG